ncbi:TIGR03084 family metal-binding protein [Actinomadura harenae]|uniref:TIGR03084 family metal-binding protein n=1 Tax=Actinomadura harenae TaxID=2483351 RepID=UPI0026859155|nr:TIGR03084 family metal-binding protein [Actinomadura harenae]
MGEPSPEEQLELVALLEGIAEAVPERECLVWHDADGRHARTWRSMVERSRRLARVLRGKGLGRHVRETEPWESSHDHLALCLHNGPEYLEGLVGAHMARVAPFNVNYRYTGDELARLFEDARPSAVIYHARYAPRIIEVLERTGLQPLLLPVDDESGTAQPPNARAYEDALEDASDAPLNVAPSPADLHILYTGGTTGLPKGVLWRIGDLMLGPLGMRRRDHTAITDLDEAVARAVRSTARVLVGPPLMHGAGTWSALGGWCGGACVVFPARVDGLDAADLLAVAERERITRLPLVGDAFARPIVAELERREHALDGLRTLLNSAAGISPGVKRRLLELLPGARIVDVLGSSETGFQVTRQGADDRPFAISPGAVVLSADRSRALAPGEDELGWLAKGGTIPLGYLNDPVKTAETFVTVDGARVVVAGDRARILPDGTVHVHGREATTINTGGEKVFAEEVETVLRGLPGVADALVVGRPSERWGTEIVAVVRPAANNTATSGTALDGTVSDSTAPNSTAAHGVPTDADLREGCAARLARYKIPKAFVRTDASLRLPNGKADYAAARILLGRGLPSGRAAGDAGGMPDLNALLADMADEGASLDALVAPLDAAAWATPTPAEGWTVAHQIAHLTWTEEAALRSATDPRAFLANLPRIEDVDLAAADGARLDPAELLDRWRKGLAELGAALAALPPGTRLPWFGPPMAAGSMATARIMETWAHGEDVAEALGVTRAPTRRLRHVAHIAVRARDFAFHNRGLAPPAKEFRVEIIPPDGGDLWTWGPADAAQRVTGPALDFALLATRRRNRADVAVTAEGADAERWLDVVQTFAGPPGEDRPPRA